MTTQILPSLRICSERLFGEGMFCALQWKDHRLNNTNTNSAIGFCKMIFIVKGDLPIVRRILVIKHFFDPSHSETQLADPKTK